MKNSKIFALTIFIFCFAAQTFASEPVKESPESKYISMIAEDLGGSAEKIVSLAEAMPADKYSWRPEEGVRSVSEVFIHAASANYFLLSYLGGEMPEGFSRDAEKTITEKNNVVEFLKKSYDYTKEFIPTIDINTLDEEVELPFGKFTKRRILLIVSTHSHEHIGQAIAYARSNEITPPWSKKSNEE